MNKLAICLVLFLVTAVTADVKIYFAPKGGFAKENNSRTIQLKDGKVVPANLTNTLLDMIERTEDGGQIKIAMYAFSLESAQESLIDAAKNRGIKVKVVLDAVAEWTEEIRTNFKQRVFDEHKKAKEEKRVFDFQLKEIYAKAMVDRERTRTLQDGTVIYGTMHEKFGIFYNKGKNLPLHAFCGSANISYGAAEIFAENRVMFYHEPTIALQLAEEFARLWNEYGTPVTHNCQSERMLPVPILETEVQIISNSKPVDVDNYQRIDEKLMAILDKVDRNGGTIDVAMFSFTHYQLATRILDLAKWRRGIKVRFLMDQTQIENDDNHQGVLGPFIENKVKEMGLRNVEVRYKWRSNAFAWDPEANTCQLIHWRNLLLHHKCVVVNNHLMGLGSYNWSSSAEHRNFENIMVFNGDIPEQKDVVDRFMAEYNVIWDSLKKPGVVTEKCDNPQVVQGFVGRKLKKVIKQAFYDPICKKIMQKLDQNYNTGCNITELAQLVEKTPQEVESKLAKLLEATLIFAQKKDDGSVYYIMAD